MNDKPMMIRATHPFSYRSGEWAFLTGVGVFGSPPRVCFRVLFPDKTEDQWPVEDESHGYEFKPSKDEPVNHLAEDRTEFIEVTVVVKPA